MKKYNNYDLHFVFETKEGIDFINMEYIHPLKQCIVNDYIKCFEQDSNIKRVIVFGSSVEFSCNSNSDLDICIERYNENIRFENCSDNYLEEVDIVYAEMLGERLKKEIETKGIVVFDREEEYV